MSIRCKRCGQLMVEGGVCLACGTTQRRNCELRTRGVLNLDRYLRLVQWARARYTWSGWLPTYRGGEPEPYSRIEQAAWARYMA